MRPFSRRRNRTHCRLDTTSLQCQLEDVAGKRYRRVPSDVYPRQFYEGGEFSVQFICRQRKRCTSSATRLGERTYRDRLGPGLQASVRLVWRRPGREVCPLPLCDGTTLRKRGRTKARV